MSVRDEVSRTSKRAFGARGSRLVDRDFAVILLDAQTPVMDGIAIASKLRQFVADTGATFLV